MTSTRFRFSTAIAFLGACVLCLTPGGIATRSTPPAPASWLGDSSNVPTAVKELIMSQGEDLVYEVSWTLFKIGTVRLRTLKTKVEDGIPHFVAAAYIDSYSGLPFVSLHSVAYTEMDSSFAARRARSLEQESDNWWGMQYMFDGARGECYVDKTWQKDLKSPPYKHTKTDTLHFTGKCVQDGLSILYFARSRVHQLEKDTVPIIAYAKTGSTYFNFTGQTGEEKIDALDQPVRVIAFTGHLNIEGLFGLTGNFSGWFSDDLASVPIKAKLNVILGSVNIELIEWHRPGWKPPQ